VQDNDPSSLARHVHAKLRAAAPAYRPVMVALRPVIAFVVACLAAGTALAASPTLERIKSTGTLTFGYRDHSAPFSIKQRNGQVRGYSVELCEKIAVAVGRALGRSDLKVVWKPVSTDMRIDEVAEHKVDAECGTTTISLSRMEKVDFSVPIFVDGGSALVRGGDNAPTRVADLAGKRIAVMPATTTEAALTRALALTGRKATLVHVKSGPEGVAQLIEGRVDAYASDRMLLADLRMNTARGGTLVFIADDFSYEPYGLVVPRDDPDFRLLVNRTLVALYKSGEIDPIFIKWLAPYGNPGALLNAMFYLNSLPE
jgi:glutamate/aspartate transport system substrate-binding protein